MGLEAPILFGGTPGNAYTSGTDGITTSGLTGGSALYDAAMAAGVPGSVATGLKFTGGSSTPNAVKVLDSITDTVYSGLFYLTGFDATPAANQELLQVRSVSGNAPFRIRWSTANNLRFVDFNATQHGTSIYAASVGTSYWLYVKADQAAGTCEIEVWDSTYTTKLTTWTQSGLALGSLAFNNVRCGMTTAQSGKVFGIGYMRNNTGSQTYLTPWTPAVVAMTATVTMGSDGSASSGGSQTATVPMTTSIGMGVTGSVTRPSTVPMTVTTTMRITSQAAAYIGDSTTFQDGFGDARIRALLEPRGWAADSTYFYACIGKPLTSNDSNGRGTVADIADARATLGRRIHTAIVNLGANNVGSSDGTNSSQTTTVLNALNTAGQEPDRILWVGISQQNGYVDEAARLHLNDIIKALVNAEPNGLWLDWHAFVKADPLEDTYWAPDGRHMTATGYAVKNAFIANAVGSPATLQTELPAVPMTATVGMGVAGSKTTSSAAAMTATTSMGVTPVTGPVGTIPMTATTAFGVVASVTRVAALAMGANTTMGVTGTTSTPATVTMTALATMLVTAVHQALAAVPMTAGVALSVSGDASTPPDDGPMLWVLIGGGWELVEVLGVGQAGAVAPVDVL